MTKSASEWPQNELEPVQGAGRVENRSQGQENAGMATVTQVRAAIFDVIDQGYQCQLADGLQRGELSECNLWHPWRFDFGWPETDEENQRRTLFADRVVQRLTELREQGLG